MGNMGTYFEEEREHSRWDSGQAMLHREAVKDKKDESHEKGNEGYSVRNSYGTLRYLKRDKKKREYREGFVMEAFEAPGTPLHTDKEKHLDRRTMKRVRRVGKQTLYASETPFENQALFLDMAGSKRSKKLINYLKEQLHANGHETIRDTFGFLDQEPERMELETMKEGQKEALSPEAVQADRKASLEERADTYGKRMDTLNSRLHRKEAKERQLRTELQFMLEERGREQARENEAKRAQNEQEPSRNAKGKRQKDIFRQKYQNFEDNMADTGSENGTEEEPEEPKTEI